MANRSGGQRTGPFRLPLVSASQTNETKCWRRWGFRRLLGRKEPETPALRKGNDLHSEMEEWSKFGKIPTSRAAKKAMLHAPAPGVGEAEVPVRFDTPNSPWVGFIDLAYSWEGPLPWEPSLLKGRPVPLMDTDHVIVHDWKFTGNVKNAKSIDVLIVDPAVNIYGYEAFLGGARRVTCRWVYQDFDGKYSPVPVWFDLTRSMVEDNIAKLDVIGGQIQYYCATRPNVLDLPYDTTHCYDYGRQCPHFNDCPKQQVTLYRFGKDKGNAVNYNKDAMSKVLPPPLPGTAAKVAPPIPGKPAAPPLPTVAKVAPPLPTSKPVPPPIPTSTKPEHQKLAEEYLAAQGKDPGLVTRPINQPEAGFINPPGGPKVAADSPEMAAEMQGITKPQAPALDDLDAIEDRDTLKAMAVQIGACETGSRMQSKSLRDAIRAKRVEIGLQGKQVELPFQAEPTGQLESTGRSGEPMVGEGVTILPFSQPAGLPLTVEMEAEGFVLYVNCTPEDEEYTDLPSILPALNDALGVKDYRFIEYTGAASLCQSARDVIPNLEPAVKHLRVYTNTPEGSVLVNTLRDMAAKTISA